MARRGRRRLLVPGAAEGLAAFKAQLMRRQGYAVDPARPEDVKYEVAREMGVPLAQPGRNGQLTTEDAGRVGGRMGGAMVREMIRLAQEKLAKRE